MSKAGGKDGADEGGWLLIGLDEKMARRQGIPQQMPIPKAEFEGLADKGLNIDKARKCCLLYTSPSPRDGLLSRMPSSA